MVGEQTRKRKQRTWIVLQYVYHESIEDTMFHLSLDYEVAMDEVEQTSPTYVERGFRPYDDFPTQGLQAFQENAHKWARSEFPSSFVLFPWSVNQHELENCLQAHYSPSIDCRTRHFLKTNTFLQPFHV